MTAPAAPAHLFQDALVAALDDIRARGVVVHVNRLGVGAFRSASVAVAVGAPRATGVLAPASHLWHAGRQDHSFEWVNGLPYYRGEFADAVRRTRGWTRLLPWGASCKALYFNHSDARAARVALAAFRARGLYAAWDGTSRSSVMVLALRPEVVLGT